MKKILSLVIFTFLAVFSFGQSADEIIQKHINATGGSKWNELNSMYSEMETDMGGMKVPIKMWQEHLKAMRVEFEVQGMTGIQVVTDKAGWSLMPFMGQTKPEPTNEEQLKGARAQLDLRGQLIDYKAKGSIVEYIGEDEEAGVEVYKIKLVDKDKTETTFYIDKETLFVVKQVNKVEFQGKEMDNVTILSNYKSVNGLMIPHSLESGGMGKMDMTKVELNPTIDAKKFEMPSDK